MFILYDELMKIVSTLGFPIGVSIYLLVRFEGKIDKLNSTMADLAASIAKVIGDEKR